MNLDIEAALRAYIITQLTAQEPDLSDSMPIDTDHVHLGSGPDIAPDDTMPLIVASVLGEGGLEHVVGPLWYANARIAVTTPKVHDEGDDKTAASLFERHRTISAACSDRADSGGDDGRLWAPTAGNVAALSAAIAAELGTGASAPAWWVISSGPMDTESDYVFRTLLRIRIHLPAD